MKIEELVSLTNGLSVTACGQTLVCDRTHVAAVPGGVDVKFLIAGTDVVPRLRLSEETLARATADDVAGIVGRVATRAIGCRSR